MNPMFMENFFILYSTSKKYMNKKRVGGLLGGENNKWYCNFKIPRGYIWNNTVNKHRTFKTRFTSQPCLVQFFSFTAK